MEPRSPGANPSTAYIESIVDLVKSGDKHSYAELIRTFEKRIYTYCYCILKSREETEDAVQEIFIKAYQDISLYRKQVSFSAWLYKVAYHYCLDQLRKRSRRQRLVHAWKEKQYLDHHESSNMELESLLDMLSPEERNLLLLKVIEQYSYEEISEIMDCKPAALRKKFERLRKKLIQNKRTMEGKKNEILRSN